MGGKLKAAVMFVVNEQGEIEKVKARAPHPLISKEIEEIIKLLPKLVPGKLKGKPTETLFSLPIIIDFN